MTISESPKRGPARWDGAVIVDTDGAELRVTRWASRASDTFRLGSAL